VQHPKERPPALPRGWLSEHCQTVSGTDCSGRLGQATRILRCCPATDNFNHWPIRLLVHPGLAEIYRRKIAALHEALEDEATRDEAIELIRSLIEAVVLVPDKGSLRTEVRGELAAILAFGDGREKAARIDRDIAEQIKMVAGVGFEPTTFRL
jgi:plasmid stabilization system protein ParE